MYTGNPFERMTITLKPNTLDDGYTIEHFSKPAKLTAYAGTLFGWPWGCTVRGRTDNMNGRYTLSGDYGVTELLSQYFTVGTNYTDSEDIMGVVAGQLGMTVNCLTDAHHVNVFSQATKLLDVVSSLYSWTKDIPHQQVNVFIRGSVLNVIQRGKEAGTYSPVKYSIESDGDEILNTLMSTAINSPQITGDALTWETSGNEVFFTGSKSFGSCSMSFSVGLCVQVVEETDDATTTTANSYSNRYITYQTVTMVPKDTNKPTTVTESTYSYGMEDGKVYLSNLTVINKKAGAIVGKTETSYYPRGDDFYGLTEVNYSYDNGSYAYSRKSTRSQVAEGRPGGQASPYTIGKAASSETVTPSVNIAYDPISPSQISATDTTTLQRYADGLAYLDGKAERKLKIKCWDEHVIDYDNTVTLMDLVWYLNTNTITVSGEGIVQDIELVRWES